MNFLNILNHFHQNMLWVHIWKNYSKNMSCSATNRALQVLSHLVPEDTEEFYIHSIKEFPPKSSQEMDTHRKGILLCIQTPPGLEDTYPTHWLTWDLL